MTPRTHQPSPTDQTLAAVPAVHAGPPRLQRAPGLLRAPSWQLIAKRTIDIIGSLGLLLLLAPLLMVIAIAIVASSRGPIFYVQERVTREGRSFPMVKFRSMFRDADHRRDEILDLNEASGPIFKVRDDPRVTAVGRLLRKFSLDELPQLLNVLLGHMSLVGPRPPLPEEVATYNHLQRRRLAVRAGLTCIWQVSGRSDVDFDRWVEMDLEYIDTWTLALDLRLLLRTIPAVLTGRGAY